ncbi:MAG: hypothetical protein VB584_04475, partial [Candidatus Nitrosopelagicus sp.]
MKLSGKFLLIIISLSIISYGMSSSVYASSHSVPPISISTDKASYATGDTILLSGFVKNYDGANPVSITIVAPNGNWVTILQSTPSSDGNYSDNVKAMGNLFRGLGEYTVKVLITNNGPQTNQTIFEFVGGEGSVPSAVPQETPEPVVETVVEPEPEPEPSMEASEPVCGKGTVLKDGLCVVEENERGGGCLIATAAYGSEMAPQIQ